MTPGIPQRLTASSAGPSSRPASTPTRSTVRPSSVDALRNSTSNRPTTAIQSSRVRPPHLTNAPRGKPRKLSLTKAQEEAKEAWLKDLEVLWSRSQERFPDVCWTAPVATSITGGRRKSTEIVWAHQAMIAARAPQTFQDRYLTLPVMPSSPTPSSSVSSSSSRSPTPIHRTPTRPLGRSLRQAASPPSSFAGRATLRRKPAEPQSPSRLAPTTSSSRSRAASVSAFTLQDHSSALLSQILKFLYTAQQGSSELDEALRKDDLPTMDTQTIQRLRQDLLTLWKSRHSSDIVLRLATGQLSPTMDNNKRHLSNDTDSPRSSMEQFISLPLADAEEEESTGLFAAHRFILASRSPYFASQLLNNYADSDSKELVLLSPPFTPSSLFFTLGFLYTGTLEFSQRTFDLTTAFEIWRSAAYLQVDSLTSVIGSMIVHDFCHDFQCSPPCPTCLKRVPRTMSFASSPDVLDASLMDAAKAALTGSDFGSYLGREVGMMPDAIRQALLDGINSNLDANSSAFIPAVRQLMQVMAKLQGERSTSWTDHSKSIAEAVEDHVQKKLVQHLEQLVETSEWQDLVDSFSLLGDVLDQVLKLVVSGLTEARAAKVYQVLVGNVLLKGEEGMEPGSARDKVEEARLQVLKYVQKRWVNIRASAGFNGLEKWALKEIAGEIDVPANDLLLPDPPSPTRAKSRVGASSPRPTANLYHRGLPNAASSPRPTLRAGAAARPPSRNDEGGERPAGPINLRAAVLNRNAAKAASSPIKTATAATPRSSGRSAPAPVRIPPSERSSTTSPRPPPATARPPAKTSSSAAPVRRTGSGSSLRTSAAQSPRLPGPSVKSDPTQSKTVLETPGDQVPVETSPAVAETTSSSTEPHSLAFDGPPASSSAPEGGTDVAAFDTVQAQSHLSAAEPPPTSNDGNPSDQPNVKADSQEQEQSSTASPQLPLVPCKGVADRPASSEWQIVDDRTVLEARSEQIPSPPSPARCGLPSLGTSTSTAGVKRPSMGTKVAGLAARFSAGPSSSPQKSTEGWKRPSPRPFPSRGSTSPQKPTFPARSQTLSTIGRSSDGEHPVMNGNGPGRNRLGSKSSDVPARAASPRQQDLLRPRSALGSANTASRPSSRPSTLSQESAWTGSRLSGVTAETSTDDSKGDSMSIDPETSVTSIGSSRLSSQVKTSTTARPAKVSTLATPLPRRAVSISPSVTAGRPLQPAEGNAKATSHRAASVASLMALKHSVKRGQGARPRPLKASEDVDNLNADSTRHGAGNVAFPSGDIGENGSGKPETVDMVLERPEETVSYAVADPLETSHKDDDACTVSENAYSTDEKCETQSTDASASPSTRLDVAKEDTAGDGHYKEVPALAPLNINHTEGHPVSDQESQESISAITIAPIANGLVCHSDEAQPSSDDTIIESRGASNGADSPQTALGMRSTAGTLQDFANVTSEATYLDEAPQTPKGLAMSLPNLLDGEDWTPRPSKTISYGQSHLEHAQSLGSLAMTQSLETPLDASASLSVVLNAAIPCVIWPSRPGVPARTRLRALIRYLGPVEGFRGPMVGVEVCRPLPAALEGLGHLFNDGSIGGRRYFRLGTAVASEDSANGWATPHLATSSSTMTLQSARSMSTGPSRLSEHLEMFARAEREARRRRIARLQARASQLVSSSSSRASSRCASRDDYFVPPTTASPDDISARSFVSSPPSMQDRLVFPSSFSRTAAICESDNEDSILSPLENRRDGGSRSESEADESFKTMMEFPASTSPLASRGSPVFTASPLAMPMARSASVASNRTRERLSSQHQRLVSMKRGPMQESTSAAASPVVFRANGQQDVISGSRGEHADLSASVPCLSPPLYDGLRLPSRKGSIAETSGDSRTERRSSWSPSLALGVLTSLRSIRGEVAASSRSRRSASRSTVTGTSSGRSSAMGKKRSSQRRWNEASRSTTTEDVDEEDDKQETGFGMFVKPDEVVWIFEEE